MADTGIDLDSFSIAVRNVVWSVSVQHGGAFRILERALHDVNECGLREVRFIERPERNAMLSSFGMPGARESFDTFVFQIACKNFERDMIKAIYRERVSYLHTDTKMSSRSISDNENRYAKELPAALEALDTE